MRLSDVLASHRPDDTSDRDAVDARIAAALADAAEQWPGVELDAARFAGAVAARLPEGVPVLEGLATLRLADLYLATACADGLPSALVAFDRAFLADSRSSDDVKQTLRQKLFVGDAPKIATYAARGDLARWVRAAIARMTVDEVRAQRETPVESELLDAMYEPGSGPPLHHLERGVVEAVQVAFREAVATLDDRSRALLLQYYIDGVGVTELGRVFGVDPSNISRNLAKARLALAAALRRALLRSKQIYGDEVASLVDLVQSQLSVTGALRQ